MGTNVISINQTSTYQNDMEYIVHDSNFELTFGASFFETNAMFRSASTNNQTWPDLWKQIEMSHSFRKTRSKVCLKLLSYLPEAGICVSCVDTNKARSRDAKKTPRQMKLSSRPWMLRTSVRSLTG